jgi:Putative lumazine-binding
MSYASLPELAKAVDLYFQALHECDLAKFDQVFHPSCSLFDSLDGVPTVMPIADYRAVIAQRPSPCRAGQARDDSLISVDFLSETAAVAKVRIRIHQSVFIDHLNFLKIGERFQIVAKIWHDISPVS